MLQNLPPWLSKLFTQKRPDSQAGFFIAATGIYMVVFEPAQKAPVQFDFEAFSVDSNPIASLKQLIKRNKIEDVCCHVALPFNQYQQIAVDKPDVEEADLASALKYAAKDDIAGDLEQYLIDYFDIPAQPFGQNKVNLVAAKYDFVSELVDLLHNRDLHISTIQTEELSYRALFTDKDEAVLLITHQPNQDLLVQIVKQGLVYFSRRIRGYNKLQDFAELEIEHGVADNLSLEIQRSLDYFESQLRQAPVKRIYMAVDNPHQNILIDKIGMNFPIPVLPLTSWLAERHDDKMNAAGYIVATALTTQTAGTSSTQESVDEV
ncbi:hypothetical protein HR060_03155 [Catenovulum sp. SM1970]|uniref:hypothetical protein n=1 Tax=Marinifaba aquimaris TaxID=2741323 RepID=UPI0015726A43|nr:hypothetical protein [Marinifaba aquimaris]NTS75855.1 hypothetical protein [Marinifaba aquimaris]